MQVRELALQVLGRPEQEYVRGSCPPQVGDTQVGHYYQEANATLLKGTGLSRETRLVGVADEVMASALDAAQSYSAAPPDAED